MCQAAGRHAVRHRIEGATGIGPNIGALGLACARVGHRYRRLVGMQYARSQHEALVGNRSAPERMSTGFVHSHSASIRINAAPREATLRSLQPPRPATSRSRRSCHA